ncbi:dapper homolog 2 isoform X1 [Poecilia latipinna]|uniref:Dishevelled-binding antagonist of beta-catenin 2 n=1 Tax=Poecilia latipinna TaxID=48699 RepID=A0A3B3VZT3_9TELE|nr:PREDICTED: dapper homolog 2 isoform X1 [Poecilia latipinna]
MLTRKGSSAGTVDRGRVRERLQAALAGLQELRLLRDRHGDMVSWALQLDREEPVSALHADPEEAEEQRLEATLTALKQQLSRLRKQDVGLKTHLQQLDQQISELKLDVSKASTDQLESDSRPSSGFYELSDGGSCSRSNSCTSVYSECLSSSQTSLIPLSPTGCHVSPPPQVDVFHRRSVDESPGQPNPPRTTGLHLGSSRIRASAIGTDYQTRPRPVSTGDLERIMAQGLGCFRSADAKKLPVCPKQKISPVDPKFQRHLESCGGTEIYPYPSPLHAVALQSPIFFQGGEDGKLVFQEGQGASSNCYDSLQMGYKNKSLGYIDKLLQRTLSKSQINASAETMEIQDINQRKPAENINVSFEVSQKHEYSLIPPQAKNQNLPVNGEQNRNHTVSSNQELNDRKSHESLRGPEIQCRYSYRAVMKEYSSDEASHSTLTKNDKPKTESAGLLRNHSDKNCGETEMRKNHWQRPVVPQTSSTESPGFEVQSSHTNSPEFVHAKFVPASSQRVKVRQADRKTKAVKLKRKSSDKPRALRQQHSFSSGERTKEVGFGARGEQRRSGKGKVSEKGSAWQTHEHRQRSSSESSLYGPGVRITQKGHPKPHPVPASSKLSKNRRPQSMEYEHPVEQRRRRQATAKWQSDVDIYQAPFLQHQRSKESMQMVRSLKPGQWIGPSHPFHFSMSSNSFLQSLNARYPPAPFHMTSLYPPRCESEYSAECASLFHSTIAESSEGEMSDNTTNRFGDSESSQSSQSFSDSDSSLSLDEEEQVEINEAAEGGMVWAEAALGPTAAGQPLRQLPPRPEPTACRIKASRALKKKIRRFQPASLKVMTLV